METVQLQCGQCKKVIAIRVEHLGMQVQCPHCQTKVQTPAHAPQPVETPVPTPGFVNMDLNQPESIFAGAEVSDSVLEDQAAPQVELPPMPAPEAAPEPSGEADFSQFKKKPSFDKSVLPLLALIFLVPYALLTTGLIAYLLLTQGKAREPLEYLRDPVPAKDKGAPRGALVRPAHNEALGERLHTALGKPIQVGDLVVTPQRVVLSAGGDLKLVFRAKNVSAATKFDPINEAFVKHDVNKANELLPYTYVESKSNKVDNVYGFFLAYHKNPNATDEALSKALLGPREEVTIVLTSYFRYRDKHVQTIAKSLDDSYTWRVQVRRGFVKVDGKDVSATTVIGIDFTNAEIEREKS